MSDHSLEPMDPFEARLARDLHAASSIALRSVDAEAQATAAALTRRGIQWPRRRSISPLLVVAVVAATLALVMAVATVGISPQSLLETPTVRPSVPAVIQVASPSPSGSPRACMTDTVQVLSGAAMGPVPDAVRPLPGLGAGRGVFTSTTGDASVSEIWAVDQAGTDPTRIGEISGGGDILDVLGLSSDGSQALIRIGVVSPSGASPECGDLYLAATDGSAIRRLTHFTTGTFVAGGAISPDGTRVAYATWTEVAVLDLATGATVHEPGCTTGIGFEAIAIRWSATIDRFAVECNNAVVYDPSGATPPIEAVANDTEIGMGWAGATLKVGRSSNGAHQNGFHVDTFDPLTGHTVRGPDIPNTAIDWAIGTGNFSPSGQRLIAEGFVGTDDALYLIDPSGGAPRRIGPNAVQGGPVNMAWTLNGQSVVFADLSRYPTMTLTRVDVATAKRTALGGLPTNYDAGAWRIP